LKILRLFKIKIDSSKFHGSINLVKLRVCETIQSSSASWKGDRNEFQILILIFDTNHSTGIKLIILNFLLFLIIDSKSSTAFELLIQCS
jgi:hypothetical protein